MSEETGKLNRGCDSAIGVMNRVAGYRMFLTKHFCLLLEFYFPAKHIRGKCVQTN